MYPCIHNPLSITSVPAIADLKSKVCDPTHLQLYLSYTMLLAEGKLHLHLTQAKQPLKPFLSAVSSRFLPMKTILFILCSSGPHRLPGEPSNMEWTPCNIPNPHQKLNKQMFEFMPFQVSHLQVPGRHNVHLNHSQTISPSSYTSPLLSPQLVFRASHQPFQFKENQHLAPCVATVKWRVDIQLVQLKVSTSEFHIGFYLIKVEVAFTNYTDTGDCRIMDMVVLMMSSMVCC